MLLKTYRCPLGISFACFPNSILKWFRRPAAKAPFKCIKKMNYKMPREKIYPLGLILLSLLFHSPSPPAASIPLVPVMLKNEVVQFLWGSQSGAKRSKVKSSLEPLGTVWGGGSFRRFSNNLPPEWSNLNAFYIFCFGCCAAASTLDKDVSVLVFLFVLFV